MKQNNSRLVSMTYPNGRVLSYNYNAGLDSSISRLSSISDNSGTLESYLYLGLGTVVQRSHPQTNVNQTFISQTGGVGDAGDRYPGLDRFGRIVEEAYINAITKAYTDDYLYTYDRDSNVLTKVNNLHTAFNETYTYNGLNELTGYTRANGDSQSYGLDAVGNMTSVNTNGTNQTRTANAQNQYTSVSGGTTPTYDNNGNLTTDPTNGNSYVYDAWNRLVTVKASTGVTQVSYQYDALGRRVTETESATTTALYYNSKWQVIEERVAGLTQVQYVWSPAGIDRIVLRDSNPDINGNLTLRLYVQQDANGNVTGVTDVNGNVVERYLTTPYGSVTVLNPDFTVRGTSSYSFRYLWQGKRYDWLVGLFDSRIRIDSPGLERPLQPDPLGLGPDINVYRWEGDNPLTWVDPSGLAKTVGISFVNDDKTQAASSYAWWNTDIHVKVDPSNPDWAAVQKQIAKELGNDCISFVLFTGHGGSASFGPINQTTITTPSSAGYQFLVWLKSQACADGTPKIRINACSVASGPSGKDFITDLAKLTGYEVKAWDDWYAIVPHGKEFTGYPNGTCAETGDTGRVYSGSWIEWLSGGPKPSVGSGKPGKSAGKKGKGGKAYGIKSNPKGKCGVKDNSKPKKGK